MEIQSITENDDKHLYIKNFKTGIDQYRKRIAKAKENLNSSKNLESLILSTSTDHTQRESLISSQQEVAWNSFEKLQKVKRQTIELENVSIEIGRDLNKLSDKIKTVGSKVDDMNMHLITSNSLISRMIRRENRNKAVLLIFSVGLIMTFVFIIYMKLFSNGGNANEDDNTAA